MEHSLLLIGCLIYSQVALACTEAGLHEFDISKSIEISCGTEAKKIALAMASTIPEIEKNSKSEEPRGKSIIKSATLYHTKKNLNDQNVIGYNVTLNTQNYWQCNYCVDMVLDSKNRCYVIQASRFICAK